MAPRQDAIRAVSTELQAKRDRAAELKAHHDAMIDSAVKDGSIASADFTTKFEAATKEYDGLRDEVGSLDAHLKRLVGEASDNGGADVEALRDSVANRGRIQTPGEAFVASEPFRGLRDKGYLKNKQRFGNIDPVEVMDRDSTIGMLKNVVTSDAGSAGPLLVPETRTGIIPLPFAQLTILDLIAITGTDKDVVDFMVEKTWTSAAAETGENAVYQESDIVFEKKSMSVVKIGHFLKITQEMADDVPRLVGYIDARMVYGVRRRLQNQIISGNGVGENLTGLLNWAGLLSQAKGTDSFTDAIHKGITKVRVGSEGLYEPTVVGIHPNDYETEILSRFATSNEYVYGGPMVGGPRTIWGLLPVVHVGFPQGNPLVGDFSMAELAVRQGVSVYMTDTDGDDWRYDRVAIKANTRCAFGTNTPKAFCEITTS